MKNILARTTAVALSAIFLFAPLGASAEISPTTGMFTGASNHVTTGGVTILKTADGGALVVLDTDFSLDGAPDPHVGFGKDGAFEVATDLGKLEKSDGLQVFVVPPTVNVDDFNEIYVWCLEFGVPLGIAALN
ncbi:DM13 domain-containing protein [Pseudohalocynthiibacter sp. F2068]|uniref:DM13 domain-containing protein n=1 Tax=Pseudohalocynthiibacter sp. F2068 TaxID=2926418 RepID=UPI001FF2D0DD|nr:DM13 domain-containing protein [Pseudohalocynthiibacter sp. F2068]MCK0103236.1 DM13 domain-containing protein [Pseudohalocynthiibacter sp. F2068]